MYLLLIGCILFHKRTWETWLCGTEQMHLWTFSILYDWPSTRVSLHVSASTDMQQEWEIMVTEKATLKQPEYFLNYDFCHLQKAVQDDVTISKASEHQVLFVWLGKSSPQKYHKSLDPPASAKSLLPHLPSSHSAKKQSPTITMHSAIHNKTDYMTSYIIGNLGLCFAIVILSKFPFSTAIRLSNLHYVQPAWVEKCF